MADVIKCKYCGKPLKSITSKNMGCGPECLKKHYKSRTLLDAIEEYNLKETKDDKKGNS